MAIKKNETDKQEPTWDREVDNAPDVTTQRPPPLPSDTMTREERQANAVESNGPTPFNPFIKQAEEYSQRNIIGLMLKFSKGDYSAGQENIDVPIGTQMICDMSRLLRGWIHWQDQKPVEQRMGLMIDGYEPARRDTMGFGYHAGDMDAYPITARYAKDDDQNIDRSAWETDENGKPRDPWVYTNYLVMKDPTVKIVDEGLYTFVTSSYGGLSNISKLASWYGNRMAQYPDCYPVVALKVETYPHPIKAYGKIKNPVLSPVDWVTKDVFGNDVRIIGVGDAQRQLEKL